MTPSATRSTGPGTPTGLTAGDHRAFATSGTTGTPVMWWRTGRQLAAEGEMLCTLTQAGQADLLITYAPARHLYGYLLGSVVPTTAGLPVHRARLDEPLPRTCTRPLIAAVPATWWVLERSADILDSYDSVTLVHSTAWLPDGASRVLHRHPRLNMLELHGSTETGLVGVRRAGHGPFRLADDVAFAAPQPTVPDASSNPRQLVVHSTRLASSAPGEPPPRSYLLDDIVELLTPRTYRLTGRRTRLLKINGVRVDLDHIEKVLSTAVPGAQPVCVIHRDPLRGEWYDVHVHGDASAVRAVAHAVREVLPPATAPDVVRRASAPTADATPPAGRRSL